MEQYNFKEEYTQNLKRVLQFTQANIICIVWLFISLIIVTRYLNIDYDIAVLSLFIICAFTLLPTGDYALKLIQGIRPVETKKDKEYLLPIFNEVYEQIKRDNPKFTNIKLCTSNSMEIAVQGLGKNTLHITQGAMQIYSENDLKGLIAREVGRISSGHTKGLMLNDMANKLFIAVIVVIKIASWIYELSTLALTHFFGLDEVFLLIFLCFEVVAVIIFVLTMSLVQMFISVNSRSNDYIADRFAHDNGYGVELINCLYSIRELTQEQKSIWKRLKSSEATINKRISLLEALNDIQ